MDNRQSTKAGRNSEQEAVQIARKHRDQFLAGCNLLTRLPTNGSEEDYALLQADMRRLAPDVEDSAWGHKYFSLIFPNKLDDFTSPYYQAFHLVKLLRHPPAETGRYLAACHYVAVAREIEIPLHTLGTVVNLLHGSTPYRYWRVGTSDGKEPRNQWPMMRDNSVAAIGWPNFGRFDAGTSHGLESRYTRRTGTSAVLPIQVLR